MSSEDLIRMFWQKDAELHFTPGETRIYFALLRLVPEGRGCMSDAEMSAEVGVCMVTLRKARMRLADAGLIVVAAGNGRGCKTEYTLPDKGDDVPQPQSEHTEVSAKSEEKAEEAVHKPAEAVKPKRVRKPKDGDLFGRVDMRPKRQAREFSAPSLAEVEEHYRTKGVTDFRKLAEMFYYHYDSIGWKTNTGVNVYRWQSLANKWLLREEKERKTNQCIENHGEVSSYKELLKRRIAEAERRFTG